MIVLSSGTSLRDTSIKRTEHARMGLNLVLLLALALLHSRALVLHEALAEDVLYRGDITAVCSTIARRADALGLLERQILLDSSALQYHVGSTIFINIALREPGSKRAYGKRLASIKLDAHRRLS